MPMMIIGVPAAAVVVIGMSVLLVRIVIMIVATIVVVVIVVEERIGNPIGFSIGPTGRNRAGRLEEDTAGEARGAEREESGGIAHGGRGRTKRGTVLACAIGHLFFHAKFRDPSPHSSECPSA